MKTFFNDVIKEVAVRYGQPITLQSTEEVSILKNILSEYEAGTLGKKFEKTKKRLAKKTPSIPTEPEEEPIDLLTEYYSDVKLHLDSPDALQLIELGFRKGALYNAPGNAGGAFNETISNEGVMIIDKFNIPINDLALVLYYRTLNTELGKQQKDYPRNGVEIPNEIPRVHQDLYLANYLAARSAKNKHNRSVIGTNKLEKTLGFKLSSRMAYGGSPGDLRTLSNKIISANICYIYDVDLDAVVEVPRLKMLNWAMSAGGKSNTGDTVVLVTDTNGNILYDGWSDKKSLMDIQANGTLNDDFTKIVTRIKEFVSSGMFEHDSTSIAAIDTVNRYQKEVNEIEEGYKNAAIGEANYIKSLSPEGMHLISLWMDMQETFYKKNGTSNHISDSKKLDDYIGVSNIKYIDCLVSGVHKSATRCKVVNRIAIMERLWFNYNKKELPITLDTQGIISLARESVMGKHGECITKLNSHMVNYHGSTLPLGNILSFYDTVDMLQISKIEVPTSDDDFAQYLKRNTNLIMGGVMITPNLIKASLGISNLESYISTHKLVTENRLMYDAKKKYVTGKVTQLVSVSPEGVHTRIGEKTYRSKQGFSGKTSNTIQWSPEMQNSFKSNQ